MNETDDQQMWKKFNISTTEVTAGDLTIRKIRIQGYLDSSTFPDLQEHLNDLLQQGTRYYLMDLEELTYISSAGLGVLMGILREVREKKGDLKIINMSEKIERVFSLLGFSRLMKVYSTEEGALEAFANPQMEGQDESPEERF